MQKKLCQWKCSQNNCQMKTHFDNWGRSLNDEQRLTILRSVYPAMSFQQIRRAYLKVCQSGSLVADLWFQQFELRFDTLVYRLGWTNSILEARQLIRHQHFFINGRLHVWPGALLQVNDVISVANEKTKASIATTLLQRLDAMDKMNPTLFNSWLVPNYLFMHSGLLSGKLLYLPSSDEIPVGCQKKEDMLASMHFFQFCRP